jgi:hypothetical protein
MVTADKLKLLTNFPAFMLTTLIQQAGYKKDKFNTAKFLGITNGGQFCYSVTYVEDGEDCNTKVFLNYDSVADAVSADY